MPPENYVSFHGDDSSAFGTRRANSGFDLTGGLVKAGLVATRDEAQYILIGIAVLAILGAGFFYFSSGSSLPPPPPQAAAAPAY